MSLWKSQTVTQCAALRTHRRPSAGADAFAITRNAGFGDPVSAIETIETTAKNGLLFRKST
jgi:hypothetical protein